jgi:hypothetical protein
MLWKARVNMVVTGVVAPVEVGVGALVRAHTGHGAPVLVGAEVDLHQRTVGTYRGVLLVLHLVRPTVLAVEVCLQIG